MKYFILLFLLIVGCGPGVTTEPPASPNEETPTNIFSSPLPALPDVLPSVIPVDEEVCECVCEDEEHNENN